MSATDTTESSLDELLTVLHADLYDGYVDEAVETVEALLAQGMQPYDVLTQGLVAAMDIVGLDFRDGLLFVPEVLMSARAMKAGMQRLYPLLTEGGGPRIGTIVLGTVKGDIHDIGKTLVGMMMEGAGFDVIDIGVDTSVEEYLAAIEEHYPDILGMSALLTTTIPYMYVVIEALKEAGLRDSLIVLVGGAPLNATFADEMGADAYCRDATVAVEMAKQLLTIRSPMERARA